ncbi:radical SAM protein [Fusobacterium mortiferum]|jgi:wyosine [tRNA(Phe)-imidazoG37] synthetase (radical SAM superfamily)|uniref:Radical SAM protein n=2 Tax=Fusobacterium TaxID=848 RepID=A0ABS2G543_FUSMR|nr:radical SAM protein [Fusobacterium mortiferum]MBM6690864.1 radical SAM protein [Fusobacterium mortiferum]MBM6822029.1 radical SAM protein [Fusobacterium mortiferum]MBM6875868.1 radical SAM protein [Fusobacterium mortiferum]MBU3842295.1 radical SAM protein [Candidatus Fusobacterium pullicola]
MFKHVFGPVPSRRLGVSLGVDLVTPKSCNMNCVFCECGATRELKLKRESFKDIDEVKNEILEAIKIVKPDYITFSGSGEPTLSKDLGKIIEWIKSNLEIKVCVITNSLLLEDNEVVKELEKADLIMPTLNSVDNLIFKKINRPSAQIDVSQVMRGLENLSKKYKGKIYIESFIIEGLNDSNEHTEKMVAFLKNINFTKLQLNTLDRPGTENWVQPASYETMQRIKNKYLELGISNVEIVKEMKELDKKIEVNEELLKNMKEKREYSEKDLKKIFKI